tara:strand:- start:752 stop:1414 length:663 start_codon:yes stop_codon:yes gene_type:complete
MSKIKDPTKQSRKGLIFTISSGISLGGLLAISFLIGTPAVPMTKAPSEGYYTHTQYVVPYIKGRVASGESLALKAGLRRLENRMPGEVLVAEQDLNWMLSEWVPPVGDKDSDVRMASPSIHLNDAGMHFSLPIAVKAVEGLNFVIQVKSEFLESEDGPKFRVKEFHINSLRLPAVGITSAIINKFSKVEFPPKVVEGWKSISSIGHANGSLVVLIGQQRR